MTDIIETQTKSLWDRLAKKYKITRNIRIIVAACHPRHFKQGFVCGDVGVGLLKMPSSRQAVAIVRVPVELVDNDLTMVCDTILPHGLAHVACWIEPSLGHSRIHDEGFTTVHNWIKESCLQHA